MKMNADTRPKHRELNEVSEMENNVRTRNGQSLLVRSTEAARMLAISERKLFELKERGEIRAIKIGRSVRFSVRDLEEWVDGQRG